MGESKKTGRLKLPQAIAVYRSWEVETDMFYGRTPQQKVDSVPSIQQASVNLALDYKTIRYMMRSDVFLCLVSFAAELLLSRASLSLRIKRPIVC